MSEGFFRGDYLKEENGKEQLKSLINFSSTTDRTENIISRIKSALKVGGNINSGNLHRTLTLLIAQIEKNNLDLEALIKTATKKSLPGDRLLVFLGAK